MRLSISLIVVVVLTFIGLGWLFDYWYDSHTALQENPTIQSYKIMGRDLSKLIASESLDPKTLDDWIKNANSNLQVSSYEDFPVPQNLKIRFEQGEPLVLESENNISIHYFVPKKNLVLSITVQPFIEGKNISAIRWVMTFIFYGILVLVLWLWLCPLMKRLQGLRSTTFAFGKGDLSIRIPKDPRSYIADIEQEFNRMAQQIETLVEDNKLLTRGLSHDLRTPIARLRFGLDVLHEAQLNEQQQKTLDHLNRDLVAMESMVEQLLNYARLDQSKITLNFEPVQLNAWVKIWCQEHFGDAVECLLENNSANVIVALDKYFIAQLLENLVQNGLRYGHGKVRVSVQDIQAQLAIVVEDNGDGIPSGEQKNVFKPFYRIVDAKAKQGFGLGLAFVDRIAHWHNAEISLDKSATLGGLKVTIVFPIPDRVGKDI